MLLHNASLESYPVHFAAMNPHEIQEQLNGRDKAFDWTIYYNYPQVLVFKMMIIGNDAIQGAIALENKEDHVYVHLIESAPHNRSDKVFEFIGEHLLAYACQLSMRFGHDGYVVLQSKSAPRLLHFYTQVIGAKHVGGLRMILNETVARRLIMLYLEQR
ncbi:hypothetical protein GZH47_25865 [Paenibacillus rhizovicinus]|uniref:GNAT family N-acetyltransferase n=1 Tax=Paenibacillus rhizovicinus TaxID=2704463 RepID=A0A6C0PBB8_9BACL|nr:hypothetical protein [Paenibacillus rhizovicinus]QHW33882.1 hypothetical protein GZH47_25865 [Paenibacillus rhizovicinus]